MTQTARWKGLRGEWYVVAQIVLLVLIAAGPRTWNGWPPWPFPSGRWVSFATAALLAGGASLAAAGAVRMGASLTPLPAPRTEAKLIESGVYRVVRHPMYTGVMMASFGWALLVEGWLTIGYAIAGAIFLDVKSRREEKWLVERFPSYPAYQRRVRKLIPFVY